MARLDVASVLCVVLTVLPTPLSIPFNFGLCPDRNLPCQCGTTGFQFDLKIKQCPGIGRWELWCKPCQNIDENTICQRYRHCLECRADVDGCSSCPIGRYGRWCLHECNCQNGGSCDPFGRCICVGNFRGNKCEIPIVSPKDCPQPTIPANSVILNSSSLNHFIPGSNVSFQCQDGFALIGKATITCQETETWSYQSPICVQADETCVSLGSLANGKIRTKHGTDVEHIHVIGDHLQFSCDPLHFLIGSTHTTCQGNGTWNASLPTCVKVSPKDCPQPTMPANGVILNTSSLNHFIPGSNVSFQCQEGFMLIGKATITCKKKRKWSHQSPVCVQADETCVSPGSLANGKIKTKHGAGGGHIHVIGEHLQFSCDLLHLLVGSTHTTCQGNGTWNASLPTCMKVTSCSALHSLPNGMIHLLKPDARTRTPRTYSLFSMASNVTIRTGKRNHFRPNSHGVALSSQFQQAVLNMTLPEGFHHVGTQATYECESRYYKLEGSSRRTCMANGQWSGRSGMCIPVCGRSSDPRTPFVTYGTASNIGQWPWMVGISKLAADGNYIFHCGASLIDEHWVVTAAHCVTYQYQDTLLPLNELQFSAGKYYWNNSLDDREVQIRKTEAIHVHPDYDPFSFDSDIALVRLEPPVRLTSRVQPVCLPSHDPIESQERLKEGTRGVMTGWGVNEDSYAPNVLQHVQIPVVTTHTCDQGYKQSGFNVHITSNMFCAGHKTGKHDICSGDSGGPFVFPADPTATRYILEGIASWGSPLACGLAKHYSGYVRVQRFVEWIHNFV